MTAPATQFALSEKLPSSAFSVKFLTTEQDAEKAFTLHQEVRNALPKENKHFLMTKTKSYFQDLADQKNGVLLRAYTPDGLLVGIVAVVECPDLLTAWETGVITAPQAELFSQKYKEGPIGVVQSLCVHDDWLGKKVSCALMNAVFSQAQEKRFQHLFAQVADDNKLSKTLFDKRGYAFKCRWPTDGEHIRVLFHRAVHGAVLQ